ncbi:hypothetical protein SORBI_3003G364550 [Sorghum bicolor]|uniref:Uncharacterized protein n=1 Tax=Sorghum bicolor TaxID=4558 RepID=A0A1W0W0J6_SORBI|nr:hypothetical protein SORBI_3003G364550 [Sorghum bicolor]
MRRGRGAPFPPRCSQAPLLPPLAWNQAPNPAAHTAQRRSTAHRLPPRRSAEHRAEVAGDSIRRREPPCRSHVLPESRPRLWACLAAPPAGAVPCRSGASPEPRPAEVVLGQSLVVPRRSHAARAAPPEPRLSRGPATPSSSARSHCGRPSSTHSSSPSTPTSSTNG